MLQRLPAQLTRQRMRAILAVFLALLAAYLIYRARGALAPFVLGLLAAYVLLPGVDWLEQRLPPCLRFKRGGRALAIAVVYLAAVGVVAAFLVLVVPIIVDQFGQLYANRERIIAEILAGLSTLRTWYLEAVPEPVQAFLAEQAGILGGRLGQTLEQGVVGSLAAVRSLASLFLGFTVVPFWLFFVLFDFGTYREQAMSLVPAAARADAVSIICIADDVLGAYIRGQLILAAIVGVLASLALYLLGVNSAVFLGFLTGVGNLIPWVGSTIVGIPTIIIAALQRPILGLWVLLVIVGIQQVQSVFLGPRIVGDSLRISPALVIFLLVIGNEIAGFLGLLVSVPLFALARDLIRYLDLRTSGRQVTPADALQRVRQMRRERIT